MDVRDRHSTVRGTERNPSTTVSRRLRLKSSRVAPWHGPQRLSDRLLEEQLALEDAGNLAVDLLREVIHRFGFSDLRL